MKYTKLYFVVLTGLLFAAISGCARSVTAVEPEYRNHPGAHVNPVTFKIRFHSRADVSTFQGVVGYDTANGFVVVQNITSGFPANVTAGNDYTASESIFLRPTDPAICRSARCTYRFKVSARMATSRVGDSSGHGPKFPAIFPLSGAPPPPPPPPPPPSPDFSLTATPATVAVEWGGTATYAANLQGSNGFADTVNVVLTGQSNGPLPGGSSSSSASALLSAATPTATSAVTISTVPAGTAPGSHTLNIRGTAATASVGAKTASVQFRVDRTSGYFTDIAPLDSNPAGKTCGGVTVSVTAAGGGPAIQFNGPLCSKTVQGTGFYDISPNCKVGLVDLRRGTGQPIRMSLRNLGFPPETGAVNLCDQIDNPAVAAVNICFSPDDSILFMIFPGGPGTNQSSAAAIWDMISGQKIGATSFFTGPIPCAQTAPGVNPLDPNAIYGVQVLGDKVIADGFKATDGSQIHVEWTIP